MAGLGYVLANISYGRTRIWPFPLIPCTVNTIHTQKSFPIGIRNTALSATYTQKTGAIQMEVVSLYILTKMFANIYLCISQKYNKETFFYNDLLCFFVFFVRGAIISCHLYSEPETCHTRQLNKKISVHQIYPPAQLGTRDGPKILPRKFT